MKPGYGRCKVAWDIVRGIVRIVEHLRKEDYATFMSLRGDWGRPLLLWAARRYAGMTLKEVGKAADGMDYTAVAMAIKRFERKMEDSRTLRRLTEEVGAKCET